MSRPTNPTRSDGPTAAALAGLRAFLATAVGDGTAVDVAVPQSVAQQGVVQQGKEARAMMVDLHRHLSRGSAPAAALAAAQAGLDPSDASTAGSFVCLGAG